MTRRYADCRSPADIVRDTRENNSVIGGTFIRALFTRSKITMVISTTDMLSAENDVVIELNCVEEISFSGFVKVLMKAAITSSPGHLEELKE